MDEYLSLKWKNHSSTFLQILGHIRKDLTYSDVTLTCSGKFYSAHRMVLTACSDYFRDIFEYTDCKKPVIVLNCIASEDLETLLDYMYLGEVNVKQADITSLIKAAEYLQIKGLAVTDDEPLKKSKLMTVKRRLPSPTIKSKRKATEPSPQFSKQFKEDTTIVSPKTEKVPIMLNKTVEQVNDIPPYIKEEFSPLTTDGFSYPEQDPYEKDDNTNSNSYLSEPAEIQESYLQTGPMGQSSSFQEGTTNWPGEESSMGYSVNEYSEANASNQSNKNKCLICHICQREFQFLSHYKVHMRFHAGEKPFSCPSCKYKSAVKGNVKNHILLMHKSREPSENR